MVKLKLLSLALTGYAAVVKGSLNYLPVHPGVGGLYNGPNSETIIKGPDGSVITAQAEGGSIKQGFSQPIIVPELVDVESIQPVIATVTSAPVTIAGTGVPVAPVLTAAVEPAASIVHVPSSVSLAHTVEIVQQDPHVIETELVDAPIIEPGQSSDLVGPSGSISTRGSSSIVSGPASTTISEPARVVVVKPLVASIPVVASVTTPLRVVPIKNAAVSVTSPLGTLNPEASISTDSQVVTAASEIFVPSAAPTSAVGTSLPSSTLAPPTLLSTTIAPTRISISTPLPLLTANIGASIQPASSYGVINNAGSVIPITSTSRPETVASSTLASPVGSTQELRVVSTTPSTNLDIINNRQLHINPSLILAANIIPPEMGPLPSGAVDLGSTVTESTTPRGSGLIYTTQSPNIQRIDHSNIVQLESNGRNIDGRLENLQNNHIQADGRIEPLGFNYISAQNRIILSSNEIPPQLVTSVPLVTNSNPNQARNSLLGNQVINYGLKTPQINLGSTSPPLTNNPQILDQEIDVVSSQLWNRYSRDTKPKKTSK